MTTRASLSSILTPALLLAALTSAIILPACVPEQQEVRESRQAFQRKIAQSGVYCIARADSSWTGSGWRSRATYQHGALTWWTATTFSEGHGGGQPRMEHHTGSAQGNTPNPHHIKSMEELYNLCETQILTKPRATWDITFETDDQGIMSACYAVMKGCADDCSEGVNLSSISFSACVEEEPAVIMGDAPGDETHTSGDQL